MNLIPSTTRNHHDGLSPVSTVSSRRRHQRRRRQQRSCVVNHPIFIFILSTLLILLSIQVTLISGQDQVEAEVVEYEYSQSDLEIMTETELEDICIKRGFQLVNDDLDPETGEKYSLTKQDYVEAAQRCLAIEKEMYVYVYFSPRNSYYNFYY